MPVTIGTTYVSIYKLIPEYLITKRYWLFGLYSFYTLIISICATAFSVFYGLSYLSGFHIVKSTTIARSGTFIITCIYLVVIIISAFKLLKLNLKQSKTNTELETKILETQLKLKEQELNYLKMQIQPHFLFNTLNTLYGYALNKSEATPEMILKLSNLLDYLLYQVDKPQVLLSEEINHIKDYIALEQMRFNDTLNVVLNVNEIENQITVAPMLFLPFVENSFKHGKINDGKLSIEISFKCSENYIDFKISNTHDKINSITHGIGLENIKKRLGLLYQNRYNLSISETGNTYDVQLQLNTKND